jgi:hypothetical protein
MSSTCGGWVLAGRWRVRGIVYKSSGPWPVIAGAPKELYCSAAISCRRSEVAYQGVVLAGVDVPLESGAQADDLGRLGVDDENAVLDPVAVGL